MYCSIRYYESYETNTQRCINHLILYFSLSNNLTVLLNGKKVNINDSVVIINHCDLYKVISGDKIIAIIIPMFYLSHNHKSLFISHYDYKKLSSISTFKLFIFQFIYDYIYQNNINTPYFYSLLHILNKEARVTHSKIYKPIISSNSKPLNDITTYINNHSQNVLTTNDLGQHLFFSPSYISILFIRHLDIYYKNYIISLKITLSIPELLLTNSSITSIAHCFGFNSYNNYLTNFKKHLNTTPIVFKRQYYHFCTCLKVNIKISSNYLINYLIQFLNK